MPNTAIPPPLYLRSELFSRFSYLFLSLISFFFFSVVNYMRLTMPMLRAVLFTLSQPSMRSCSSEKTCVRIGSVVKGEGEINTPGVDLAIAGGATGGTPPVRLRCCGPSAESFMCSDSGVRPLRTPGGETRYDVCRMGVYGEIPLFSWFWRPMEGVRSAEPLA